MAKQKFDLATFEGDDLTVPRGLTAHLLGAVRGFTKREWEAADGRAGAFLVAVVDTESGPVEVTCDAPFIERGEYGAKLDLAVDITSGKNGGDPRVRYQTHRVLGGPVAAAIVESIDAGEPSPARSGGRS
jgi:hypothetical protein